MATRTVRTSPSAPPVTADRFGPSAASLRLPGAFVLGAPRTGTTSLAHWLGRTPGAFVPRAKELKVLALERSLDHGQLDWYANHYTDAAAGSVLIDASPQYLASPLAPGRIAALRPDARMVAILREPVSRALSHHAFHAFWGADQRTFADAMAAELSDPAGAGPHGYLATSRYAPQLRRYLDTFPAEQLLTLRFEDLQADPAGALAQVLLHFGLDPDLAPPTEERLSPAAEPRHPLMWRATRRWRMRDWRGRLGSAARALDARNMRPASSRPAIDPALAQRLHAEARGRPCRRRGPDGLRPVRVAGLSGLVAHGPGRPGGPRGSVRRGTQPPPGGGPRPRPPA